MIASVVDAVQAAVDIQRTLETQNAVPPASRRMRFRIGINLSDVIVEDEQLYGDGVNIAARMERLAEGVRGAQGRARMSLATYLRRTLTAVNRTVTIACLTSWGSNRVNARIQRDVRSRAI